MIPYRTAKFKSANIFYNGDLGLNCQIQFPPIFLAIWYTLDSCFLNACDLSQIEWQPGSCESVWPWHQFQFTAEYLNIVSIVKCFSDLSIKNALSECSRLVRMYCTGMVVVEMHFRMQYYTHHFRILVQLRCHVFGAHAPTYVVVLGRN